MRISSCPGRDHAYPPELLLLPPLQYLPIGSMLLTLVLLLPLLLLLLHPLAPPLLLIPLLVPQQLLLLLQPLVSTSR